MKRFIYVILILFSLCGILASYAKNSIYPSPSEVDSLIKNNDVAGIDSICKSINMIDSSKRCHKYEVVMLHRIIDSLNFDLLMTFLENRIGRYDAEQDSLSPLEYFTKEPFKEKVTQASAITHGSDNNSALLIQGFLRVLMFFQDHFNTDDFGNLLEWLSEETAQPFDGSTLPVIELEIQYKSIDNN